MYKKSYYKFRLIHFMLESEPEQELPTESPLESENKFVGGFVQQLEMWKEDGQITPEEHTKISEALEDPKVKIYLNILVGQLLIGQIVRTEAIVALSLLTNDPIGWAVLGEGFKLALKYFHVQVVGRKLPMKKRQLLAVVVTPPIIGSPSPIAFIHQNHPELAKFLKRYLKQKGSNTWSSLKKRSQIILDAVKNMGNQKI